jgi:MFS family permease
MPFCPNCGIEYRPGFARCSDCEQSLVDAPPALSRRRDPRSWLFLTLAVSVTVAMLAGGIVGGTLALVMGWADSFLILVYYGAVWGGLPLGLVGGFVLALLPLLIQRSERRIQAAALLGAVLGGGFGLLLPLPRLSYFALIVGAAGALSGYAAAKLLETVRTLDERAPARCGGSGSRPPLPPFGP